MSTLQNFTPATSDVSADTSEISYYVIEIVFAVFAILGNLIVIMTYLLEPRLRNTLSNIYLISLAVSDFCMGAIAIPIILIALQGIPRSFPACLFLMSILILIDVASVCALLAMTLDRYYSISRPLRYCVIVTKSRAVAGALLAWFVAFLFIIPMLAGWHNGPPSQPQCYFLEVVSLQYMTFVFFAAILAPFFLMCFVYIQIYIIIRKQLKQMRAIHDIGNRLRSTQLSPNNTEELRAQRLQQPSTNDVTRENQSSQDQHDNEFRRIKREWRTALFFAFLMVFFFASWVPIFLIDALIYFGVYNIPQNVINFCVFLSHFNSAFNPFLYTLKSDFRAALKRMVTCKGR